MATANPKTRMVHYYVVPTWPGSDFVTVRCGTHVKDKPNRVTRIPAAITCVRCLAKKFSNEQPAQLAEEQSQ